MHMTQLMKINYDDKICKQYQNYPRSFAKYKVLGPVPNFPKHGIQRDNQENCNLKNN